MNIGKISSTFNNAINSLVETKAMQKSAQRIATSLDEFASKKPQTELDLLKLCTKIAIETPKAYLGALAEKLSSKLH